MGIVFLFAIISGMRPEEFLGLRWSDLDLNREQPDGTLRSVARVKQVLCWRRKKGGGWYIDETKTSHYTDPKTGVRGLRLYDLRHSCATLLLAEGKHAKVVADRLGHASVAMTLDVYSHVTRRLEDEVAESFDRKFNKPNEKRRSGS